MGSLKRNWPAIFLLASDIAGFYILLNIAHRIRVGYWTDVASWPLIITLVVTLVTFYIMGAYNTDSYDSWRRVVVETTLATAMAGVALVTLTYLVGMPTAKNIPLFWRGVLPFGFVGFALYAGISRILLQKFLHRITNGQCWLVIGDGAKAERLIDEFITSPTGRSLKLSVADFGNTSALTRLIGTRDIGLVAQDQVESDDSGQQWQGVIVCQEESLSEEVLALLTRLRLKGVRIYEVGEFYEMFWLKVPVFQSDNTPLTIAEGFGSLKHEIAYNAKHIFDFVAALACILLLWPLMLLLVLMIRLNSAGPAFYWQTRVGARGKPIRIVKFRTMRTDAEKEGIQWASINDPRVTKVGKILRRWRIDELPQMWNVVKGDMSLIGPRPERPELIAALEKEVPFYDIRHIVKPGITGWAQVKHPYGASIEDARKKLEFDLYYIKNYSLILDLAIAIKTLRIIAMGAGR